MKKRLVTPLLTLVALLALVLSAVAVVTMPDKPKRVTAYDMYADGTYDLNTALVTEKTFTVMQQNVRVVRVFYAAKKTPKKIATQQDLTGIIAAPGYVLVSDRMLSFDAKKFVLHSVVLLPSAADTKNAKPEPLSLQNAIYDPDALPGTVVFRHLYAKLIKPEPLQFGAIADVVSGTALYNVGADGATQEDGRTVPAGAALTAANSNGSSMFLVGTTSSASFGDPVFALRDGTPEFVGVIIGTTDRSLAVLGVGVIASYLVKAGASIKVGATATS